MTPIVRYFAAEKIWCTIGALIALLSIGLALWFFFRARHPFQSGVAWPFLILGIIFFIICLSVALRSEGDAARVSAMLTSDRSALAGQELPRMTAVMRNFTVIISLEIAFLAASICLLLWANLTTAWKGAMTGLLIQATWLLVFDLFARSRGSAYLEFLRNQVGS